MSIVSYGPRAKMSDFLALQSLASDAELPNNVFVIGIQNTLLLSMCFDVVFCGIPGKFF